MTPSKLLICLAVPSAFATAPPGQSSVPQGRTLWSSYGLDQGLDNLAATRACQDRQGFIWVGTQANLFRYESGRFKAFGLREGLPSSYITALLPAEQGGVIVGTWAGLVHIDTDHIRTFPELPASRVLALQHTRDGQIWISFQEGLWAGRPGSLHKVAGWNSPGPAALAADRDGVLWASRGRLLLRMQPDGTFLSVQTFPEDLQDLVALPPSGLICRGSRGIWHVPRPGIANDLLPTLPGPPTEEGSLYVDPTGRLWIPTLRGLAQWTGSHWSLFDERCGLPIQAPTGVLVDRDGSLWAIGRGVHRQQGRGEWKSFTQTEGLPHEQVWSIQRDLAGRIWVGTRQGLVHSHAGTWKRLSAADRWSVRTMAPSPSQGGFWVGTVAHGLFLVVDTQVRTHLGIAQGLPEDRIMNVHEDPDGSLWIATGAHGLWHSDPGRQQFRPVPLPDGTENERINQILPGPDGSLWIAAARGLARLRAGTWTRYGREHGLRHPHVGCLGFLPDGRLGLGYFEPLGLSLLDLTTSGLRVSRHLDLTSGLRSDLIYFIQADAKGRVWIGTGRGLDILAGDALFHQGRSDGLVGEDSNALAVYPEANGGLWVGTSEGLAYHAGAWAPHTHQGPPLVILEARVGNRPSPEGATHPRQFREFMARFTPLTTLHEDQIVFEYRLVGHSEEWIQTPTPEARLAGLGVGTHRFEVRARIGQGPVGPVSTRTFTLAPAWWQLKIVLIPAGLLLVGLITWLVRLRLQTLRKHAMELEVLLNLADQLTRELEASNRSLQEQSMTDPLTGLRNRRYIQSTIDKDVAAVTRAHSVSHEGRPVPHNSDLIFVMVDLDHFKQVNDTEGHPAGDAVLTQMADILRSATRGSDAVVRWGGEEFLVIARHANRADAATLAERIRAAVARTPFHIPSGNALNLTCSVGFCAFPVSLPEPLSWEEAIARADQCLYLAKGQGRNRWRGYSELSLESDTPPMAGPRPAVS